MDVAKTVPEGTSKLAETFPMEPAEAVPTKLVDMIEPVAAKAAEPARLVGVKTFEAADLDEEIGTGIDLLKAAS